MVQTPDRGRVKRLALWIVVILYTALLPEVIRLYEWIVSHFSQAFAARMPLIVASSGLVLFGLYVVMARKGAKGLIHLFLCICLAVIIFQVVDIPTKRIHIPEYILMCWLLYEALKRDYRGKGGMLFIFTLSSLLGVVDEALQGFHTGRYYGYPDMVVNSLSSAMGVIVLAAVRKPLPSKEPMEIKWRTHWPALLMTAVGATGATVSCSYLGEVAAHNTFFSGFPLLVIWLDTIGSLGIVTAIFCSIASQRFRKWFIPSSQPAAVMWLLLPMSVFYIIMSLTVVGYLLGLEFR